MQIFSQKIDWRTDIGASSSGDIAHIEKEIYGMF